MKLKLLISIPPSSSSRILKPTGNFAAKRPSWPPRNRSLRNCKRDSKKLRRNSKVTKPDSTQSKIDRGIGWINRQLGPISDRHNYRVSCVESKTN